MAWPTATSVSTSTSSAVTVPSSGLGISVSTLSVEISAIGWSIVTVSPTSTNQARMTPLIDGLAELGQGDLCRHVALLVVPPRGRAIGAAGRWAGPCRGRRVGAGPGTPASTR